MTDPAPAQLVLDVHSGIVAMTRGSFFEGPCNTEALSEILTSDFWDGGARVLTGTARVGKTHLAQIFRHETGALVLRADRLAADSVPRAAERAAVVLEDAHRLGGDAIREQIAFHLFNQARDLRQPLLVTGRGAVRDWGIALPDLSSRLTAAAQIRVTNPDTETLRMVLVKLFSDRQLAVPPGTVEYALHRMERSFAAASALVAALDRANLLRNRRIDRSMIREILTQEQEGPAPRGGPEFPSPFRPQTRLP
ncbi:P-loop NTPase family protein [Mangrovicoccus algicola]|uniref:Chromosomal replication initiator DnaA n=1 Tax=Mangrovicoccus algicola TaxID=2771008 RepID=A0A8J6YVT1_9RHOB|nr:chromosomal replication initiator DnaA [Mangrovicoccus algicola]MBE3640143.1 chromosomal replication initiator DnaA [Mangrovicoccus algicola]